MHTYTHTAHAKVKRCICMVVPQDDFIKLYINHRPVLPLDKQNIHAAFEKIAARFPSSTYSTCLPY